MPSEDVLASRRTAYLSRVELQNTMDDMVSTFGMGIISAVKNPKTKKLRTLKPQHGKWPTHSTTYGGTIQGAFTAAASELKKMREFERAVPKLWIESTHARTVHAANRTLSDYRKQTSKIINPVKRFNECGVRRDGEGDTVTCRVLMPYDGMTLKLLARMGGDHTEKLLWLGVKTVGAGIFVARTAKRDANCPWETKDSYIVIDEHDVWGMGSTILNARKDQERARTRAFLNMMKGKAKAA